MLNIDDDDWEATWIKIAICHIHAIRNNFLHNTNS